MSDDSSTPGRPSDPYDWDALGSYLAGETNGAEAEAMKRRLAEHPDESALIAKLDAAIQRHAQQATAGDIDVESALRAVKARRDEPVVAPLRKPRVPFAPTPTSRWRVPGFALAAGIVIVLGVLLWPRLRPASTGPAVAAAQVFRTQTGERDSIRLSDSSLVVLGPRSELRVAAGFGTAERSLELVGEALFEVRHDDARPFVVRSGDALIRDVGTVFTVRSSPAGGTRVVVTEGAVLLQGASDTAGRGVVLHAGDVGVLDSAAVAHRGAARPGDLAWTRGELVFREAPLSAVAEALERWYGVTLRLPDTSTAHRPFSGDLRGDSLDNALRQLSLAFGANLERRGDTVFFRPVRGGRSK